MGHTSYVTVRLFFSFPTLASCLCHKSTARCGSGEPLLKMTLHHEGLGAVVRVESLLLLIHRVGRIGRMHRFRSVPMSHGRSRRGIIMAICVLVLFFVHLVHLDLLLIGLRRVKGSIARICVDVVNIWLLKPLTTINRLHGQLV